MAMLTVRNLSDEVHRALRIRAAQHGRSTEAEVRHILAMVALPSERIYLGDTLAQLAQAYGVTNADVEMLEQTCTTAPAEPLRFE